MYECGLDHPKCQDCPYYLNTGEGYMCNYLNQVPVPVAEFFDFNFESE